MNQSIQLKNKWVTVMLALFLLLCGSLMTQTMVSRAASGVITFSTKDTNVKKGEMFTVVCQISATSQFMNTEFSIEYDSDKIRFVSGGSKVSSSGSMIQVASNDNEVATNKKTFSLQFIALKKGTAAIALSGTAKVTDAEGAAYSISSNRLVLQVVSAKAKTTDAPSETTQPVVTPEPVKSKQNSLKTLKLNTREMIPAFSKDVTEYNATVDCNTETLLVSFVAESHRAVVQLKGNDKLTTGMNEAEIIVTAENGEQKVYKIHVKKESQLETTEREEAAQAADTEDVTFSVEKQGDKIVLSNQYQFEVLNPEKLTSVPSGYVLTNIELNGVRVPAYTVENDLDNNYLLFYLKGPSGEMALYQFDREEQTIQRYTGSMVEKINKGQIKNDNSMTMNQYVVIGIIVGLVCIILVLLIAMLKMAIRKKEKNGGLTR
ncbi:MAG: cadherin-like beta sandwich domain-containing protein [Eubacterium sp.]|nr:cadherin-like beta sandwich domain-containing protein [Eubacterium sp.]